MCAPHDPDQEKQLDGRMDAEMDGWIDFDLL